MLIEETHYRSSLYYVDNCWEPLIEKFLNQRPTSGTHRIELHHDNAGAHIHKEVVNYLESESITVIRQSVNSPNLAP